MIVLSCGSFFKDYYVGVGTASAGAEAVDELRWYFDQAEDGLLVLHQVQKLPTAIQEELVVRCVRLRRGQPAQPAGLGGS